MSVGSAPSTFSGFGSFENERGRPLSYSPQSRPKKHRHRRSAAMSEDLNAVELSTLLTPQIPSTSSFSSSPVSTSSSLSGSFKGNTNPMLNTPLTPSVRSSTIQALPVGNAPVASEESPRQDSLSRVSFVASPSPRRQVGEPGQLVLQSTSSTSSRSSDKYLSREPSSVSYCHKKSHTALESSPTVSPNSGSGENRKKRRSFAKIFRKSVDLSTNKPKYSPPRSPPVDVPTSESVISSMEDPDATIVPVMTQSPMRHQSPTIPAVMGSSLLSDSPLVTPRTSGEMVRDTLPTKPTIDLDEAMNCSFDHRGPSDPMLDSPFSKTSTSAKPMGAVLEEDGENEENDSESSSLSSIPLQRPPSILQKTNSVSSSTSTRHRSLANPWDISRQPSPSLQPVVQREPTRTISYVGPGSLPPPSMSPRSYISRSESPTPGSPPRSPRFSFEQVSNLAIGEAQPRHDASPRIVHKRQDSSTPKFSIPKSLSRNQKATTSSPSSNKKGHNRRKSLLDRLIGRD